MKGFELYEPTTVPEAVGVLTKFGVKARPLGGGSDVVTGVMKDWVHGKGMPLPDALVDLTTIPDLHGIKATGDALTIGATTTLTEIAEHPDVQGRFPLLQQAALSIASPLIRNFATIGGNINQRPRCWFFRGESFNCYKKGGDFCFAVTGDNRYHAIIGGELLLHRPPVGHGDGAAGLERLGDGRRAGGDRQVPFDTYFIGPREDVLRENVLKPEEIMVNVSIPTPAAGSKMGWTKLKDRQVYDFAIASVAAVFTVNGNTWQDGRIVLGGVSPVPYRAKVVEDVLKGKDIKATIKQAAAALRTVARPMSLNAYKVDVVQGLIERTVLQALG